MKGSATICPVIMASQLGEIGQLGLNLRLGGGQLSGRIGSIGENVGHRIGERRVHRAGPERIWRYSILSHNINRLFGWASLEHFGLGGGADARGHVEAIGQRPVLLKLFALDPEPLYKGLGLIDILALAIHKLRPAASKGGWL